MILLSAAALAPSAAIAAGLLLFRSIPVTFILFHGCICLALPLIHLRFFRRLSMSEMAYRLGLLGGRTPLFLSLLTGLVMGSSIYLTITLLGERIFDPGDLLATIADWGVNRRDVLWFMGIMVILNSLVEEIYWRGYMTGLFSEVAAGRFTIPLTALFYSLYHGITTGILFSPLYAVISVSVVFIAGLFWAWTRRRTGNVVFGVISHLLADLGIMLIYITLT